MHPLFLNSTDAQSYLSKKQINIMMTSIPTNASFIRTYNEGVRYFEAGKYNEAIAALQVALVEMRSMLALKQMDDPMALEESSIRHRDSNGNYEDLTIQSAPLADCIRRDIGVDNSSAMTFFDRAFRITTAEDSKLLFGANENKTCCLLLYNIAVSHQALGLKEGNQGELSKAFRLYRMALEFLRFNDNAQNDSTMLMLSLALMNNVAHIQSSVFNFEELKHCVSWLREAAHHFETSCLCEEDYMFFFLRFFVLPSNEISSAPAA
jgi:tetratricopeptide (TPR) repeat protein